ncbi:DUF3134 domain-containing protein [Prochlorothrix hollandica]|uniref:DUF3134 domain-containing protein n=1 Tax=Prochlorothrix hollandica PCC 9006 = CALU 1027 TaxID=317619 RepID=A0A0M2PQG8_PROHO|nr:DUF3134 domain-containing protein [Prochlorothrix hollandica]KKI98474.1 hypothetical protein PROH_18810 [Prochlorothrix hollandica PCC 9006 = CALU 1027]
MTVKNPALQEYPRYQAAPVLPSTGNASILDWLEATGRLLPREVTDPDYAAEDAEEIEGLMVDDNSFEEDDDDDDFDGDD